MTARILVVDDIAANLRLLEAKLVSEYYEVLLAASGPAALEIAFRETPDVILLDVMMPGVDGPSTVLALRTDPATRDIPIIFLTAKVLSEDLEEWRDLGLAGVIPKPFDPLTLATDMAALLGWQETST